MKKALIVLTMCMTVIFLAACGSGGAGSAGSEQEATTAAAAASDGSGDMYRVVVNDEAGKPVPGVIVQFCSDQFCQMGETDADGIAAYPDSPEGVYHVKVYSVPEGYAEDTAEYPVPEKFGDVTITLKAAE